MFFEDLLKPLNETESLMTVPSLEVGWVREINESSRQVKVELEGMPGLLTDWIPIMQSMVGVDIPIHSKGSKVVVGNLGGDSSRMIVLGTVLGDDHPNESLETRSPSDDYAQNIFGDHNIAVVGNHTLIVNDSIEIESTHSTISATAPVKIKHTSLSTSISISPEGIQLQTAAGGLVLLPGGGITFLGRSRGFSSSLQSGSKSYGNPNMELSADGILTLVSPNIEVQADSFTWNGKRVSVVGDRDTRGDTNL